MGNYFTWVDPEGKKRKTNGNTSSIPLARFPEAAPTSELANATSHLPSTGTSPSSVSTVTAAPILSSDSAALTTSASTAAEAVVPVPAVTKKGGHMKKKLGGFQKGNMAQKGENAVKSRAKTIAKRKATQAQVLPDANQPASAKRASIAPTTFVSEDTRRSWTNDPKVAAAGVRKIKDYVQLEKTEEALAHRTKQIGAHPGRAHGSVWQLGHAHASKVC